jgi:hypothetical protein
MRERLNSLNAFGLDYVRLMVAGVIERHIIVPIREWRLKSQVRRGAAVPHELRELYVTTAFFDCLRRHVPSSYVGDVTLFRAQFINPTFDHVGSRLGWSEAELPNLSVIEVPGDHDSLVREPNVRVLSAGIDEVLRRASA